MEQWERRRDSGEVNMVEVLCRFAELPFLMFARWFCRNGGSDPAMWRMTLYVYLRLTEEFENINFDAGQGQKETSMSFHMSRRWAVNGI